jgi:hypothetical protein
MRDTRWLSLEELFGIEIHGEFAKGRGAEFEAKKTDKGDAGTSDDQQMTTRRPKDNAFSPVYS